MSDLPAIDIRPEIATALREGRPIVALESTLISHGLPWPVNLETARAAEKTIHEAGAIPATIAVLQGRPTVGLWDLPLKELAKGKNIQKSSRRDLAATIALGHTATTTVAATMFLAHQSGIRVLATGGIGGAHRPPANPWDVSSDLIELANTPVAVVCAGAKGILDIPRTLEILETFGVPVIGYGTNEFPAFYVRSSGQPVSCKVDTPKEVAKICLAHWNLGGAGLVIAQALPSEFTLEKAEFESALSRAEKLATEARVQGSALTPFLLARIAEATQGKTLKLNHQLVVSNAKLGAELARELIGFEGMESNASPPR
jgi:pseudouridine-5'-phosphate glycosidase